MGICFVSIRASWSDVRSLVAHRRHAPVGPAAPWPWASANVKTQAPRERLNKTLGESALRSKYGVTVVGVKRPKSDFAYAQPETLIQPGDPAYRLRRFNWLNVRCIGMTMAGQFGRSGHHSEDAHIA